MELYSTGEAANIIDIHPKRLVGFISRGVIEPEEPSAGRGRPAKLNLLDIVQARIIADLSDMGLGVRLSGEIAEAASARINLDDCKTFTYNHPDSYYQIVIDLDRLHQKYFFNFDYSDLEPARMKRILLTAHNPL